MATSPTNIAESLGTKALGAIPVVGPILSSLANTVIGIFGASHAAAVTAEAKVLNSATPAFLAAVVAIMKAVNSGSIEANEAVTALQTAESNYLTAVHGITDQSADCKTYNLTSTAGNNQCPIYNNALWRDCADSGSCNASCAVNCGMVQPTVLALIAIIEAGGGKFVIPGSPANGAIAGTPQISITYVKPSILDIIEQRLLAAF